MLRWLHETGLKPACDTLFAFPIYEEIGHGGAYVPEDVSEYVALDITLIGPDSTPTSTTSASSRPTTRARTTGT